jgi:hypothetical protein
VQTLRGPEAEGRGPEAANFQMWYLSNQPSLFLNGHPRRGCPNTTGTRLNPRRRTASNAAARPVSVAVRRRRRLLAARAPYL